MPVKPAITPRLQDVHVQSITPLICPDELKKQLPLTAEATATVADGRQAVVDILSGQDPRLLAVVGPCSIHDPKAALEYATRLRDVARKIADRVVVFMRVYFEKPRTTLGWKGLVSDPHLDGSLDMATGLRIARQLLLEINALGLPAATEMLDPITPQYLADLIAWAAIGARTTESQTHRQMASGLSMPVGFKNATSGDVEIAVQAMQAARSDHSFLGIDGQGRSCIVRTTGNPWGHLILRGGKDRSNYDPDTVAAAVASLKKANLPPIVMVDCSHANSEKKPERQEVVWYHALKQRARGQRTIFGLMLESNLHPGNQPLPPEGGLARLKYGVSITDACIGWEKTEQLLLDAAR